MVSGFFTKKITQLQSVGDLLEQRRLSLGIALERVARETSIQARYIRAIELGDASQLPAEIYVRGFVRTYARYLRLDESGVLEQWERERGIAKHLKQREQTSEPITKTFPDRRPLLPKLRLTPMMVRSGLIGLVLMAGFVYISLAVSSLGRAPDLRLDEPTSDRVVHDGQIVVVGGTRPEAELTINGQPVQLSADGFFRETINLQSGMNQIRIIAHSKLGRTTEIVRNIQANLNPVASAKKSSESEDGTGVLVTRADESEGPVDLTLRITQEATWVSVNVDGQDVFTGTVLPNAQKHFVGQESIVLTSGKGQYTAIRFNGEELNSLGEGFVRDVTFTPDLDLRDLSVTAVRE